MTGIDLRDANLTHSILERTVLIGAQLRGAHLSGAKLSWTVFANADLYGAFGLDSCIHLAPCIIDHRTISKSGILPLLFLRGCGLPDSVLDVFYSLGNKDQIFLSCFISFSTKDQGFADRLHADLQNKGVRCWFAPHDMKSGKKLHQQIAEAIRLSDRLLLILSEHSMDSEWVKTEIAHARQKELNEGRRMLFPISLVPFERIQEWKCYDADTAKDSAREIREYFIPDFTSWKDHDSYQIAFRRLVKDLEAEGNRR